MKEFNSRHIFIFLIIAFLLATTVAAVALQSPFQLLTTPTTTANIGSPSGMEIITSNGPQELSLLRGCGTGQLLKLTAGANWACASDITTAGTGAGAIVVDLGDNGVDEASNLAEIATTGDTNAIFTVPAANKLLILVGNAWPTATALAANPTDCGASAFAISIVASGNLTCAAVAFSDLSGAATDAQVPNTITIDLAALATALAANGANCAAGNAPLGVSAAGAAESCFDVEEEGEILTTAATGSAVDDSLLVGSGASTATWQALSNCVDSGGNHLNYTAATNTFSCGTSSGGSGYTTIQEEGAGLTARAILNFIGATITCVDNGGSSRTDCTISAGGSTNSFETMDASSGTDPVADSATDTLLMIGTSPITVTGSAAADSLTFACATCVTSVTGGAGIASSGGTTPSISTDSGEQSFIGTFAPVCGGGTDGIMAVSATTPLQYCDGFATPTLRYAAYANSSGVATSATALAANGANCAASSFPLGVDASGAAESCSTSISGNAATATALAANGANCSAGNYPLGVDTLGAAESCTAVLSFSTITPTSGTSPVADSATDTVTFTAGVNITVTGNSGTDDITFAATGVATQGGRSLTFAASGAGASIDADVELFTHIKSINILNPTTAETNKVQVYFPLAVTLTRVVCSTDVGTLTMQLDKRVEATPNTAGTNALTSTLVCDTDSQATTSFSSAAVASRIPLNLQITATASTPTIVRIHIEYTIDD